MQRALDDKRVVRATFNRGTLHLVTASDYVALRGTIQLALDHGKELFAVPGSEGTDALLEEGAAHPCTSAAELVRILAAERSLLP